MGEITIIGLELAKPGNIGAAARVMQNFGFDNLVLINPKCDYLSKEAVDRATHAKNILLNAEKMNSLQEAKKRFDTLVATTARTGNDYNIQRTPLTPEQFSKMINNLGNVAIVLGREDHGLSNEEVAICDFIVTIPAINKTMNVSHALAIILYELFKSSEESKRSEVKLASGKEKEALLKLISNSLNKMEFSTKEKKETQIKLWKRIVGKSMLTKREAFGLCGFFRKLQ